MNRDHRDRSDLSPLALRLAGLGAMWLLKKALERRPDFDYEGRTVLVTGGSRGLGLVIARQLARRGARLIICARDHDELVVARDDLTRRGATVHAYRCDVSDRVQVNAMVRSILEKVGHIDVLINNAGVIQVGPMEEMTLSDYEEAMKVHFWGPLYMALAVIPGMKQRGQGRIVNISSVGGKISVPHMLPYGASKFALVGFSEGLRAELYRHGVYVTTVCPGLMRTGSTEMALFKGQHRLEYLWFSLADSMPGLSISAGNAVHQILEACRRGDAELTLTLTAKIATLVHGLAPGLTTDLMAVINQLLPGPGGIGSKRARGKESHSTLSPSVLTTLNIQAAARNNEL